MHETNCKLVKGFIDEKDMRKLHIKGWCYHETYLVCPIRIKYSCNDEIIFQDLIPMKREDVSNFYVNNQVISSGWEIDIVVNKQDLITNVTLEMFFDEKWYNIFEFGDRKINIPSFIVLDHFYDNVDEIRELALRQTFEFHPNNHKGKRTEKVFLFDGLKERFESILNHKIKNWNNYPVNGCFQTCIAGDQLVYHVDIQEYAGLIFLTPDAPPNSGTSFYRSKYTKRNKVGLNGDEIVFKNGFLDSTEFELVDQVGNVYNRLVLFDAQMIHAASNYFGNKLENGRLFQMFFFDLE
jgi:hypothetical protein